jgi:AcrR family transcriptional regulator
MDPDEDALPRGVALAWGVSATPQRGPKRELNIERIVETAVGLADDQGLAAVSMASIATALGFTTMSLYRYVSAKDDLVLLMQEAGVGQPPLSIGEAPDWRDGLTRWYRASLEMYAAHPWILDIPVSSAPNTPNNLLWMDAALGTLRQTPLDERSRVAAVLLLSGQSRWEALVARGRTEPAGQTEGQYAQLLAGLVTPEQFPDLYLAIHNGAFLDDDNAAEFGVSRILDGLEHHMAELAAGRSARPLVTEDLARDVARDDRVKKATQVVKDAETRLRDARQKRREAISKARERVAKRG